MHNFVSNLVVLFLLLAAPLLPAKPFPLMAFDASYQVSRHGTQYGKAQRRLQLLPNQQYQLTYQSQVSWLIFKDKRQEQSQFLWQKQLVPLSYEMTRSGTGRNKSIRIMFDQQQKKVIKNNQPQPIDWQNDWYDQNNYQLQLAIDLKQQTTPVTTLSYEVIDRKGKLRHYQFVIGNLEVLTLPYGQIQAIRISRQYPKNKKKKQLIGWFAPKLDYALVRLQSIKKNQEQFDIQLAKIQFTENDVVLE